jgi:hypothetical protein
MTTSIFKFIAQTQSNTYPYILDVDSLIIHNGTGQC